MQMHDTTKREIRKRLREYLEGKGINTRAPFKCLNPEHNDTHPSMSLKANEPGYIRCFGACNRAFDVFDVIGWDYGLSDFREQYRKACEIFGYPYEEPYRPGPSRMAVEPLKSQEGIITPETLPNASKAILEPLEGRVGYDLAMGSWMHDKEGARAYLEGRGLTEKTIGKIGYDRERQAAIIPIGQDYYIARRIGEGEPRYLNPKGLKARIYGQGLISGQEPGPIFLVEGVFDALSIEEVGGRAIALNSTSNTGLFLEAIDSEYEAAQGKLFLLALDNDATGRAAAAKIAQELQKRKIAAYQVDIAKGYKDANEALVKGGREAFQAAVREATMAEVNAYRAISALGRLPGFMDMLDAQGIAPAIPTGFRKLDSILDGGLHEGLYVIGAISSIGKTTLALQMADQISENGQDVLFFSLEMAASELMAKSLSRCTFSPDRSGFKGLTSRAILSRPMNDHIGEQREAISKALAEYQGRYAGNLYIIEGAGEVGSKEIAAAVEKHRAITGKTPVVIVDYLQVIAPKSPHYSDKQNADRAVLDLKRISRDNKLPLLVLSSFSRAYYDKEATMEAFKESGGIEYSADVLMGLQYTLETTKAIPTGGGKAAQVKCIDIEGSKKKEPRPVMLKVLKNRQGATEVAVLFDYYFKYNLFAEAAIIE